MIFTCSLHGNYMSFTCRSNEIIYMLFTCHTKVLIHTCVLHVFYMCFTCVLHVSKMPLKWAYLIHDIHMWFTC